MGFARHAVGMSYGRRAPCLPVLGLLVLAVAGGRRLARPAPAVGGSGS